MSSKNQQFFLKISVLASKKRSNQKSSVRESKKPPPISGTKYFFLFDLFLEARTEILKIISLVFLGDLKAPKGHFEIN